jgi:uncharacterized membrane protein YkvA (DUF1232 family)
MLNWLKAWAQTLESQLIALWFASRHAQTPLLAKALAIALVAYAFSPIDLIPDFVPVLGYLDDVIVLPIGIWVVLRMIPDTVLTECRARGAQWLAERHAKPRSYAGLAFVVAVWIALAWLAWLMLDRWIN